MNEDKYVFTQVTSLIPRQIFQRLVKNHPSGGFGATVGSVHGNAAFCGQKAQVEDSVHENAAFCGQNEKGPEKSGPRYK